MNEFYGNGTLGDTFIVYCKLYDYWKRTRDRVRLYRVSNYREFDNPLSEFFKNVPFIKYETPCILSDPPYLTKKNWSKEIIPDYINVSWDGRECGKDFKDPEGIKMEPFPEVFIKPDASIDKTKFCIGIQLNCGGHKGNKRGISLRWVKNLRRILSVDKYSIFLFGTLGNKNADKVESFCLKNNIENYVGKTTFLEWLSKIMKMDLFITFEGFPAYFAMSQKIKSLVFFIVPSILIRIPPEWREQNIIWRINHPLKYRLLKYNPHYSPNTYPIDIKLIKNMIEVRTMYI